MSQPASTFAARREFLKFLAASPYVAALGGVTAFLQQGPLAKEMQQVSDVIASPSEALDVLAISDRKSGTTGSGGGCDVRFRDMDLLRLATE